MRDFLIMRVAHICDHYRINGMRSLFKEVLYFKREAKVIEKYLADIAYKNEALSRNGIVFSELTANVIEEKEYYFKYRHRGLKAVVNLKKGCGGHCILKGREIVGDVWFFSRNKIRESSLHKDVEFFKMNWDENCVYSFDTFVAPEYRGDNVSATFMNNHLWALGLKGFNKVYGYYWDDNWPAKWNAKVNNGWKEIQKVQVSRFFIKRILHSLENIEEEKTGVMNCTRRDMN